MRFGRSTIDSHGVPAKPFGTPWEDADLNSCFAYAWLHRRSPVLGIWAALGAGLEARSGRADTQNTEYLKTVCTFASTRTLWFFTPPLRVFCCPLGVGACFCILAPLCSRRSKTNFDTRTRDPPGGPTRADPPGAANIRVHVKATSESKHLGS